jgi:hypothetical protein
LIRPASSTSCLLGGIVALSLRAKGKLATALLRRSLLLKLLQTTTVAFPVLVLIVLLLLETSAVSTTLLLLRRLRRLLLLLLGLLLLLLLLLLLHSIGILHASISTTLLLEMVTVITHTVRLASIATGVLLLLLRVVLILVLSLVVVVVIIAATVATTTTSVILLVSTRSAASVLPALVVIMWARTVATTLSHSLRRVSKTALDSATKLSAISVIVANASLMLLHVRSLLSVVKSRVVRHVGHTRGHAGRRSNVRRVASNARSIAGRRR